VTTDAVIQLSSYAYKHIDKNTINMFAPLIPLYRFFACYKFVTYLLTYNNLSM